MSGPTDTKTLPMEPEPAGDDLRQSTTVPFEDQENHEKIGSVTVAGLSSRESEVLGLLARGLSYKEIAVSLHLSTNTVNTYLRRLYKKLQVRSRGKAVAVYMQFVCGNKLWPRQRPGTHR